MLGQGTAAKEMTGEHLRGLDKHTYMLGRAAQRNKQQQRLLLVSKAAHRKERKLFGNSASFSVRLLFSSTSTTGCSKTHTNPGAGNTVIATSIGRSSAQLTHGFDVSKQNNNNKNNHSSTGEGKSYSCSNSREDPSYT